MKTFTDAKGTTRCEAGFLIEGIACSTCGAGTSNACRRVTKKNLRKTRRRTKAWRIERQLSLKL